MMKSMKSSATETGQRSRSAATTSHLPSLLSAAGERWRFDTAAGKEEMLARRIGENELSAIKVLQAIVDAQIEYASEDRNGDGVVEYAHILPAVPASTTASIGR